MTSRAGLLEVLIVMFVVVAVAAVAISALAESSTQSHAVSEPLDLPSLDNIRLGDHAVDRHGDQAREARRQVFGCNPEHLRVCAGVHDGTRLSVYFWCEEPGQSLCPAIVTTIGGKERTSFVKPCSYWYDQCGGFD